MCKQYVPIDSTTMGEPVLACPVCGFYCVHPVALECRSPGTKKGHLKVDSNGIHLDPQLPPVGRGVMIAIRFVGECGHAFNYTFHFHKGSTAFFLDVIQKAKGVVLEADTIWRD